MFRRLALTLVVTATAASASEELGLDLSAESQVKTVVLIPPVYKVATTEGFAGMAAKVTEKLDTAAHKKLVQALEKTLGAGKVVSTDATLAALTKEQLKPPNLRTAAGMAQLAKATNAAWVIFYDVNKGVLAAAIYTLLGETTGKTGSIANVQVASLTAPQADELQKQLSVHLVALSQPKPEEVAAAKAQEPPPPPPAEEEVSGEVESELARERAARKTVVDTVDNTRPRFELAIGGGAAVRNQLVGGDQASQLAEQRNNTAAGLSVFAKVNPFNMMQSMRELPLSDLFVDLNYRRDFVRARAAGGTLDGLSCGVVDDELQARLNYRWRLGGVLPSVGLGVGWAQERAVFTGGCTLPVVSAVYRGVDVQLRVHQRLFRDLVFFDLAFGPRVLVSGPLAPKTGFSLAGEGWLEAKPFSLLFARGGVRFFRAVMSDDVGVVTVDVRAFFALEVGVHL